MGRMVFALGQRIESAFGKLVGEQNGGAKQNAICSTRITPVWTWKST